ncbi:protein PALS2-like [Diadema setosum]|uniref:protein PALS2-like n=1 Tax=Diadema setosum TaxID=31175 RepID=UPI003B3B002B
MTLLDDCCTEHDTMPATDGSTESGQEAIDAVVGSLEMLENSAHACSVDLLFLREVMQSKLMQNLIKAHDTLEDTELKPHRMDSLGLAGDVMAELTLVLGCNDEAAELAGILQDLNFISLLRTHDDIASGNLESPDVMDHQEDFFTPDFMATGDAIRMVGIRKSKDEPLGVTFKVEDGEIVVARIIHGSVIDKQGLLHVGDIIQEVNDHDVTNDPDALRRHIKNADGRVTLKIRPSYQDCIVLPPIYVRAFFDYNPSKDTLLPCQEVGLPFRRGDILCVVERDDMDWYQAYVVGREGRSGLIPSQELEERRRAFVPAENIYTSELVACGLMRSKKKKRQKYETRKNHQFDRSDIVIYEEVQEMPPFQRKTIILLGAQGVGRRTLKNRLIEFDPSRFGVPVANTSRLPREGEINGLTYNFTLRSEMESDILNHRYLEYGEFANNLYGTTFDSIQEVNRKGQMCVLDVNPQSLKLLRNSEFLPFVVFVASPDLETLRLLHEAAAAQSDKQVLDADLQKTVEESARIERLYSHFFDFTIINSNLNESCLLLCEALDALEHKRQWVPIDWVYDSP